VSTHSLARSLSRAQWNFVLSPEAGSQDPSGTFCRRWLPELARLPNKYLHTPWLAPAEVLSKAGVTLGVDYPHRILDDLPAARRQTVGALLRMRAASLDRNDPGGYDLITLPSGESTRVFTKQEFRLNAAGQPKPPPPTSRGKGGGRGRSEGGSGAAGTLSGHGRGRGRAGGGKARGPGAPARQRSVASYFEGGSGTTAAAP
jgi:hypothetical protein